MIPKTTAEVDAEDKDVHDQAGTDKSDDVSGNTHEDTVEDIDTASDTNRQCESGTSVDTHPDPGSYAKTAGAVIDKDDQERWKEQEKA